MTEYRLFGNDEIPYFTTPEFFAAHPWVPPGHQIGHAERTAMTAEVIKTLINDEPSISAVIELGCGDGTLGKIIAPCVGSYTGYDACTASLEQARLKGLDVHRGDIREVDTHGADLVISCEVIEHMHDPHLFIAGIESRFLILTSPVAEDDLWHYEHHAWAWDAAGYIAMARDVGWKVLGHDSCQAPPVTFAGGTRNQAFQCLTLEWGNGG